jgi:hypothetical protein
MSTTTVHFVGSSNRPASEDAQADGQFTANRTLVFDLAYLVRCKLDLESKSLTNTMCIEDWWHQVLLGCKSNSAV